jgi:hypothetical protein
MAAWPEVLSALKHGPIFSLLLALSAHLSRKELFEWHVVRVQLPSVKINDVLHPLVNQVQAYNLGNLWRRLVIPRRIGSWTLTSLQQRLVKTGGRPIKHARY